jgi:hypothetical protein
VSGDRHVGPTPDSIDVAIQKAAPRATTANIALLGNQNRPALLVVPDDITEMELLGLIGAVLQIGDQLRARRPVARLLVPQ